MKPPCPMPRRRQQRLRHRCLPNSKRRKFFCRRSCYRPHCSTPACTRRRLVLRSICCRKCCKKVRKETCQETCEETFKQICRKTCGKSAVHRWHWRCRMTAATMTSPSIPTRRRRRFAARCRRRSRLPRRRSHLIRRSQPARSICLTIPTLRSRGRRCCRSPRCRTRSTRRPSRLDPTVPRWNFEIPFVTPQGTAVAQFEISRDGGRQRGRGGQAGLAGAVLARRRAGRPGSCTGVAERRPNLGADVGGAAGDRRAIAAGAAQLSQALTSAEFCPATS